MMVVGKQAKSRRGGLKFECGEHRESSANHSVRQVSLSLDPSAGSRSPDAISDLAAFPFRTHHEPQTGRRRARPPIASGKSSAMCPSGVLVSATVVRSHQRRARRCPLHRFLSSVCKALLMIDVRW